MAVLVTGAAGFVGLNLVEHLLGAGRTVVGLDRIDLPARARATFAQLPGRLIMVGGSVMSASDLSRAMTMQKLDAVVHAAAITAGAEREATDPETIVAINVGGAVATLCAAARRDVPRFVYPSSVAIYGAATRGLEQVGEDDVTPTPATLYALTKRAAETILPRVAETHGVRFAAARLGSVYGPWEYATGVRDTLSPMWRSIEAWRAGAEVVAGPAHTSDYIYARDVAAGLTALMDAPSQSRTVYNLGSGHAGSAPEWCRAMAAHAPGFRWRLAVEGEAPTVQNSLPYDRARLDVSALTRDTGWAPRFGFDAAAADYVGWCSA